jgi:predicted lipid-binding transport protein (Tim44 family)
MRRFVQFFSLVLGLFVINLATFEVAEAARMGSGKSFGQRPAYNQNQTRDATAAPAAPQQQAGAAAQAQPNRGMLGGMGGMLGGLLAGGLLAALFMGGAFDGLNMADMLIFAAIALLIFYFVRRRAAGMQRTAHGVAGGAGGAGGPIWPSAGGGQSSPPSAATGGFQSQAAAAVPANFDSAAFLAGAKAAYRDLQAAWDSGDLSALRQATTDAVFAELQDQLRQRQGQNQTEVLRLEAEVIEVRDLGREQVVTVMFDVMMREEDDAAARPQQVREIWHFVRNSGMGGPAWLLEGIQQLEG